MVVIRTDARDAGKPSGKYHPYQISGAGYGRPRGSAYRAVKIDDGATTAPSGPESVFVEGRFPGMRRRSATEAVPQAVRMVGSGTRRRPAGYAAVLRNLVREPQCRRVWSWWGSCGGVGSMEERGRWWWTRRAGNGDLALLSSVPGAPQGRWRTKAGVVGQRGFVVVALRFVYVHSRVGGWLRLRESRLSSCGCLAKGTSGKHPGPQPGGGDSSERPG
ncbi:uncharacterized protein EI97DRAFT_446185 [Westerdykella ornata]|uniref:Uncharacterized protein n=1 Tax=Westerdykella ornata TaxID=318751 RepID=A0A6A6J5Y8_WESOR|nr:uncharacterized protein EI97DRAFT_446185 [Westerdykella ornata]KAF2272000.1 hypothetical protein EI97DRAFT_446185 [Westerdykella ornata]